MLGGCIDKGEERSSLDEHKVLVRLIYLNEEIVLSLKYSLERCYAYAIHLRHTLGLQFHGWFIRWHSSDRGCTLENRIDRWIPIYERGSHFKCGANYSSWVVWNVWMNMLVPIGKGKNIDIDRNGQIWKNIGIFWVNLLLFSSHLKFSGINCQKLRPPFPLIYHETTKITIYYAHL